MVLLPVEYRPRRMTLPACTAPPQNESADWLVDLWTVPHPEDFIRPKDEAGPAGIKPASVRKLQIWLGVRFLAVTMTLGALRRCIPVAALCHARTSLGTVSMHTV
jgi:hypothetical protein